MPSTTYSSVLSVWALRWRGHGAVLILAGALLSAVVCRAQAAPEAETPQSGHARLGTFDTPGGQTYFALSLMPRALALADRQADVIALFDTSASQTGLYRETGLEALKMMLASLDPACAVKLMAVDLKAVAMTDRFVPPQGDAIEQGLQKLRRRTPLGATDLDACLRAALVAFADRPGRLRSIVYVGDGLSRANFLKPDELRSLVEALVERRVAVSSYAVGPQRDVSLLAALANHTGGTIALDSNESNVAHRAGMALANSVRVPVLWPTAVKLPAAMREVYPVRMPPFRTDRDTILIGMLDGRGSLAIHVTAEWAGGPVALDWRCAAEPSNEEFGFLPQLVTEARDSDGWTLPTVGSAGLREAGRVILAGAQNLVELGERALKTGDLQGAERIADLILRRDPSNPQGLALKRAIQKKRGQEPDEAELILKRPAKP